MLLFKPQVLPLLGAKDSTYDYCYSYLFWTVTIGAVPTVMNVCLAHLIRAEGLSKQAGFGVALGGLLNIALDPVFIFVFRLTARPWPPRCPTWWPSAILWSS